MHSKKMKQELAEATANKLREDDRVDTAEIDRNEKGIYVKALCHDRMAARELKGDLGAYPVFVQVMA